MSFPANLFVTLTEMDVLGSPSPSPGPGLSCPTDTGYQCKQKSHGKTGMSVCYANEEVCMKQEDGLYICHCVPGTCLGAPARLLPVTTSPAAHVSSASAC